MTHIHVIRASDEQRCRACPTVAAIDELDLQVSEEVQQENDVSPR